MPVTISEVEAEVQVDAGATASPAEPQRIEAPAEALQRWQEMARREWQLEARTAAWNFDD